MRGLLQQVETVVAAGNCSGCGACLLLDSGLQLQLGTDGFSSPALVGASAEVPDAASIFQRSCPGLVVRAGRAPEAERHPTMGPVVAAWRAWAADDAVRTAGSSGGTLTALATWLRESGRASRVIGAQAASPDARRTVPIAITTREQALAAAGSRYAPVTGALPEPGGATIGQPCRISAMRAQGTDEILLSFYCAGTPSQSATDALAAELGVDGPATSLQYRGDGWPGRFTVTGTGGTTGSMSYDESWGSRLGRQVHPRCKLCPDGIGESADITAADLWDADDRGYPTFEDQDGVSALIARTARGYQLVLDAVEAGVLVVHPLRIERLAAVQPLQVDRRRTLAGRLLGARLAGRPVPRYRGFGLVSLALPHWRLSLRAARGTWRRMRRLPS